MENELDRDREAFKKLTGGPTWKQVGQVVAFLVLLVLGAIYLNARSNERERAQLAARGCEVDNTQLEFMLGLLNRATTPKILAPGSSPQAIAQQEADNAEAKRYRDEAISRLRARSCSELLKGHLPEPLPIPAVPAPIPVVPEPMKAPTGLTGAEGKQGPKGDPGQDGRAGRDGVDGRDGPPGPAGLRGPEGPQGPPGPVVLLPPEPTSGPPQVPAPMPEPTGPPTVMEPVVPILSSCLVCL